MKNIIIPGLVIMTILSSCEKTDFDELNKNPKESTEAPAQPLYASAAHELNRQVATLNVNYNNTKLWSQYLTQTTYLDESNYDLVKRNVSEQEWRQMYREVIRDLKEAKDATNKEKYSAKDNKKGIARQKNRLAVMEIMTIYSYERLTIIFGDVPYKGALGETNLPKFDDAKTIYTDLLSRLDKVISIIDVSNGSFNSGYDNLFGGDMMKWKKFAYGIKMKMGITMADKDKAMATTVILDAWDHVFSDSKDVASFDFLSASPNTNPMYEDLVISGRNDFVVTSTIVDKLNELKDPRSDVFFSSKITIDTTITGTDTVINKGYKGGVYGKTNSYNKYSHIGSKFIEASLPCVLMDYAEMEFYKAEAIERGIAGSGSAEEHYKNGITASIEYWTESSALATSYLANTKVAYATAAGDWKEKIGTQAWIAYFNRGVLAWTSIRRLDFPKLNQAAETTEATPVRYTYPINEQTLNGTNYTKAASAIGGDTKATKLWWDMH